MFIVWRKVTHSGRETTSNYVTHKLWSPNSRFLTPVS